MAIAHGSVLQPRDGPFLPEFVEVLLEDLYFLVHNTRPRWSNAIGRNCVS